MGLALTNRHRPRFRRDLPLTAPVVGIMYIYLYNPVMAEAISAHDPRGRPAEGRTTSTNEQRSYAGF